jgi:hypothetical protein
METTMHARWVTPAISLVLGVLLGGAAAIGGQPSLGAAMLAVMVAYSAILVVFGGRSDTMGVLSGQPVDERYATIGIHATALAGVAAILVAMGGFLWAIAHGESGNDFALVVATAGIAYLAALLWYRVRG